MVLLSGFLEVLLRSLAILGQCAAVGGIIFSLFVLRPFSTLSDLGRSELRRSLKIILAGCIIAALSQGAVLLIEPWALADEMGQWPAMQFLHTGFARAGIIHAAFAILLSIVAAGLIRLPGSRAGWFAITAVAFFYQVSGAWLTHGVSRVHGAAIMMTVTVIHQTGAVILVGGAIHLALLRRLMRKHPEMEDFWPLLLSRFSPLETFSVSLLLLTGFYLSFSYIGEWKGLIGTAYGAMVLTKLALLACVLCLNALNFFTLQEWLNLHLKKQVNPQVTSKMFVTVDAVALSVIVILLTASALTSQPPSIDVMNEAASFSEVFDVFAPKIPQLLPPPHTDMIEQSASSFDPFANASSLDSIQSNFNHNISGLMVLLAGFTALIYYTKRIRLAMHWPLLFLGLSLFLLLFAEPNGWPFGYESFWATLVVPGVLQHRLSTVLAAGIAIFEWRVRTGSLNDTKWQYAFPFLCILGGALLLTHSHSVFALKRAFLIEVSHNALGFLAVITGLGRMFELRFPPPSNRLFGFIWIFSLIFTGLVLLFYSES